MHPFNVFVALMTYASGRGLRGQHTWSPVGKIVDVLDAAFYTAFGNVDPIPGYVLIALDTSGSMQSHDFMGVPGITPARAQAVLALVTVATSPDVEVIGFDQYVEPITLTARQRIDDAYRISALGNGRGTDVSLPMTWATQNKRKVDAFIVSTDGQTWAGHRHPMQALEQHRQQMGVRSRLANLAMVSNEFTVAAPDDPGVMEFVGFDSAAPQLISDFVSGKV
jgi:60 kDa SS-A/Ro ribonucleoprotein